MMEFLIYDLKVAGCVAVFYMFYRLMLSRETLHGMNRVVLLSTAVASFVLPLCVITVHHTVVVPRTTGSVTAGLPMMAVMEESQPLWQEMLVALFFAGIAVTLGKMLWAIGQVVSLIRRSECHPQADGTIVAVTDKDVSPFSWMRYIVLNRKDYESPDPAIMAHERGHIRKRHSLDVLLVDTLTVLQWFNPAMWMLRQDLRAIHEYEADAAVLSQGINMRQYQYLLIQKAVSHCGYSVANGISHSTLKNRINMMLHKNSSRASLLKLLALVPIVGIALAIQAETVNDYVYTEKTQTPPKKVIKKGKANAQVKMGNKTIQVKKTEKIASGKTKEPLIMIDGKRSTTAEMDALDEKRIDHINVLKEKAATEIYGAEGINGVIEIKTKKPVLLDVVVKTEAQTEPDDKPFDVVEQMPEFPGGQEAFMQFLRQEVKYPKEAEEKGLQGRVVVRYIIEKDGSISEVEIVKSVNEYLDAEAIRVVNAMPKWKPGKQKGENVRVKYTLPISFRLS
jgi:TonB family protein